MWGAVGVRFPSLDWPSIAKDDETFCWSWWGNSAWPFIEKDDETHRAVRVRLALIGPAKRRTTKRTGSGRRGCGGSCENFMGKDDESGRGSCGGAWLFCGFGSRV